MGMMRLHLNGQALFFGLAAALLAGCGGPTGAPGAMPWSALPAGGAGRAGSWVSPEAKSRDLLYVSTNDRVVYVFDYPQGRLVGELTHFLQPEGLCSDSAGNVFITDKQNLEIFEYAHGGKTPIKTLVDNVYGAPGGCAVDPKSGDLAVTNPLGSAGYGNVVIYKRATGEPKAYYSRTSVQNAFEFCSYDDKGNLFITTATSNYFYRLAKGAKQLTPIAVMGPGIIYEPTGVQWHKPYFVVGDQYFDDQPQSGVYQLSVSRNFARIRGSILLTGSSRYVSQFTMQGHQLIAPDEINNDVALYNYPLGGPAFKMIGVNEPIGTTISLGSR
ncbi:MAG: hypothetical protein WB681_12080 [Candidatus Cybelea sp.]